jgi:hypothetical protein
VLNSFRFHHSPPRYRSFRTSTIFNPNPTDPSPLINDLIRSINRWRTHPRRQQKQQMLEAWKQGKLIKPDGQPVPPVVKSTEQLNDIIAEIYFNHLETFKPERSHKSMNGVMPIRHMANTPRSWNSKPYPPPKLPDVLEYVNDIWEALHMLPSIISADDKVTPYKYPLLPGVCPYPNLLKIGFIQPRPGAYLRTKKPPQPILSFTSTTDFEEYIYSLAFHRDISPRTGKMIMSAFLNYRNSQFLSLTSFRYAIVALIERASDIYSARRLAEYMASLSIPLDTHLYNTFLLGAMNVESLRSFALLLREMLHSKRIQADSTTWNIALRMGIKLKSTNWVYSVLEVMKSRGIAFDQDSLQTIFRVLRHVGDCEHIKEYYVQYFSEMAFVPWKPFNVVLHALCSNDRIDEAWNLLLQESQKSVPLATTLHLFIRTCRKIKKYNEIWKIVGEFQRRWKVWPHSKGIAMLFKFACEEEQFSDATLIWEFAQLQRYHWPLDRKMKYRARELQREYGIPLRSSGISREKVLKEWMEVSSERRNGDIYHRIPTPFKMHVILMKARKLSERLDATNVPEDVKLWREIEKVYDSAVTSGKWKPLASPRRNPIPDYKRRYVMDRKLIRRVRLVEVARRIDSGLNFIVREKYRVWKMVRDGLLRLDE